MVGAACLPNCSQIKLICYSVIRQFKTRKPTSGHESVPDSAKFTYNATHVYRDPHKNKSLLFNITGRHLTLIALWSTHLRLCVRLCVLACVCVSWCLYVCLVCVHGNSKNISSIHLKLEHIVVYKNSSDGFDIGHCPIEVKVTA